MALLDDINRLLRDHTGYTGDGQGGSGPLPVGDRSTARFPINKRDLRELLYQIAQAAGDPEALQEILDQVEGKADAAVVAALQGVVDGKADIANSGKVFNTRAAAVNAGQAALPNTLGMITTREGDYIVYRAPGLTADDPLFATAPRWGVMLRVPSAALLDDKADADALSAEEAAREAADEDLTAGLSGLGAELSDSFLPSLPGVSEYPDYVPLIAGEDGQVLSAVDGSGYPYLPLAQTLHYGPETAEQFTGMDRDGNRLFGFDGLGNPAYVTEGLLHYDDDEDWDTAIVDDNDRPLLRWRNGALVGTGVDFGGLPQTEKTALAASLDWNDRGAIRREPSLYLTDPLYNQPSASLYTGAAGLYALYDALVDAHPDYITRSAIGETAESVPIYQYVFAAPPNIREHWTADDIRQPTIIMVSGTHGGERQAQVRQYLFCRNLCQHWRTLPGYARLRFGVTFVVVPAVNPWSIDAPSRKNSAGVDINRNFPADWIDAPDDPEGNWRGPSAGSEPETQAIMSLPTLHPDAIAVIDNHNGTLEQVQLWLGTRGRAEMELFKSVLPDLTDYLRGTIRPEYDEQGTLAYLSGNGAGTLARWMQDVAGIPTLLMEQSSSPIHDQMDGTHLSHRRLGEIALIKFTTALLDRENRRRMEMES